MAAAAVKQTVPTALPTDGENSVDRESGLLAAARAENPTRAGVNSTTTTATAEPNDTTNTATNEPKLMLTAPPHPPSLSQAAAGTGRRGRDIVDAWVAQAVAGGTLVVPLSNAFHPPGLAVLTVRGDGSASGRLGEPLTFMGMRGQRERRPSLDMVTEPDWCGETTLHPGRWGGNRDAAMAIGQRIGPGVHTHYERTERTMWLLDPTSGSWASVSVTPKPYPVRQAGPRRLFDEVRDAYESWRQQGKPTVADWLVSIGPHGGQRLELEPVALPATA